MNSITLTLNKYSLQHPPPPLNLKYNVLVDEYGNPLWCIVAVWYGYLIGHEVDPLWIYPVGFPQSCTYTTWIELYKLR